jgi:hypothetical protein
MAVMVNESFRVPPGWEKFAGSLVKGAQIAARPASAQNDKPLK